MFTSIHPGASVVEALKLTAENDIGSLVVLEDQQACRHHHRTTSLERCQRQGTGARLVV